MAKKTASKKRHPSTNVKTGRTNHPTKNDVSWVQEVHRGSNARLVKNAIAAKKAAKKATAERMEVARKELGKMRKAPRRTK